MDKQDKHFTDDSNTKGATLSHADSLTYPAKFEMASEGGFTVTFRDIPEAITQGDDFTEALSMAQDALVTCFDFYYEDGRKVPMPSSFQPGEVAINISVDATNQVIHHNAKLR